MYGNLLDALHTETQETMETDERESRVVRFTNSYGVQKSNLTGP